MHPVFTTIFVVLLMTVVIKTQEQPRLGSILPKIDQENFTLIPEGNGYILKIKLPDGSYRDEEVEVINPGTPEQYILVKGTSTIQYPSAIGVVTYTAGEKGYVAHYTYYKIYSLNPLALKAAAG